jgi:predicted nucleotidyltransferase
MSQNSAKYWIDPPRSEIFAQSASYLRQTESVDGIGLFRCVNLVQQACLICPSKSGGFRGTKAAMKRDEILEKLREREADLRAHGVTHAALFGSVARNEQNAESDIDILVDLDPAIVATIFDYAGVKDYVASLFQGPVDVIDREALKPRVRPRAVVDAIYAF